MSNKQTSTITQDLHTYKDLVSSGFSPAVIESKTGWSRAWISTFKAYWNAVDNDYLDWGLASVIEAHNNVEDPPRRMDRFHFGAIHEVLNFNLTKVEPVAVGVDEQETALRATLKEAQNRGAVRRDVESIYDLKPDEMLNLRFSVFKRTLGI